MISDIQTDIETLRRNTALWNQTNFESRIQALDHLEFIIDRIESLLQLSNPPEELVPLKQYVQGIKSQLEAVDIALFARLRIAIRNSRYRGVAFLNLINTYVRSSLVSDQSNNPVVGYDNLDVFTNGLFPCQVLPLATQEREPEMVFYQKTPTRIILELVANANLTSQDVFYDLGSGLGHVCVLVHLLTGTTAKGIEVEPAYCTYAKSCANELNLSQVEFICEDARTADYSDGTVFFLYTPFEGRLLQKVLDRLQDIAQHKDISVFTYGPCTHPIARQHWLTSTVRVSNSLYQLGEFKSHCC